ncbi:hypothetical protein B6I21_01415 [candidate division KSB1 bacterium 4572_119]|nr:MAG: hypothetical protein B6I21_01415 [candidate division KSB1 bacterium 4572_119]
MKKILYIFVLMQFSFLSGGLYSQVATTGGKGLAKVLSADPVKAADIFVNWNASTFMEQTSRTTLSKYYRSDLNVTVGLASYLEVYLNITPYQDDQTHLWGQFGNTHLGLKYLTPFSSSFFKLGLDGFFKFPTARIGNVGYESFFSENPAWAMRGLLSLDFIKIMPSFPLKFNFNYGYIDHDIYDQYFTSKIDQMLIGAGFKFSIRSIQFFTEYSGEIFFNNPTEVEFNQNSQRVTQGIRFLGPWNNTIDVSFDYGLTQYDSLETDDIFHKEYYDWKVRIGVTHRFSVQKYFDKTAKLERMKEEEERRKLEAIKKKRQKVKEDIQKMKNSLEKKKK